MKKVAVLQSNYIPWKGYFDIIHDVDLFVFYDDVQYSKNDWRNRNKIKTSGGQLWISIPVGSDISRLISEVEIRDHRWQTKHWKSIQQWYGKAEHFDWLRPFLEDVYLGRQWSRLSDLNQYIIRKLSLEYLGIEVEFGNSGEYNPEGSKQDRLIDLLRKTGADSYVSGPSAKSYIEEHRFAEAGIELSFKDYQGYPEYQQFFPPFEHAVSVLDLLFHTGPEAPYYIWGWRQL